MSNKIICKGWIKFFDAEKVPLDDIIGFVDTANAGEIDGEACAIVTEDDDGEYMDVKILAENMDDAERQGDILVRFLSALPEVQEVSLDLYSFCKSIEYKSE